MTEQGSGPLEGVRVLDLSRVLAGPFAAMRLADLGADVVKVEPPGGDEARAFGPPDIDGESVYFLSVNRGKRSLVLDLRREEDQGTLRALVRAADVLLSNFRPGVLDRLGLSVPALRALNPRLVICRISGFGPDDPRPGYDNVIQALSGIPAMTGDPDGPPTRCGASIGDLVGGHNAIQAVLAGLLQRQRTGEGCLLDVSLLDGLLELLVYHGVAAVELDREPARQGEAHPTVHPLRTFATKDGRLAVAVGNDGLFAALVAALGRPELALDPRFQGNPARVRHRQALDALLEPLFLDRSTAEAEAALRGAGVPCGAVRRVREALADATFVRHPHPTSGRPVASLAPPLRLSGQRPVARRGPPALGAHREEVLSDWLGAASSEP